MAKPLHIFINGVHAKSGGGLSVLNAVLPFFAQDKTVQVTLLLHQDYASRVRVPEGVAVQLADVPSGYGKMLWWEHVVLPKMIRRSGAKVALHLTGYAPLLHRRSVAYISNNPDVQNFVPKLQRFYWQVLTFFVRFSLLTHRWCMTNGLHIQNAYTQDFWRFLKRKMVSVPTASDVDAALLGLPKKHQIVTVGDVYPHKNYMALLQAFKKVAEKDSEVILKIIGRPIHKNIAKEMNQYVRDNGLTAQVAFLGPMPHDETLKVVRQSKAFVNLSLVETYSLTLLESLKLQTAAVVLNKPFNHEVAGQAACYVDEGESVAQNTADALLTLLKNETTRQGYEHKGAEVTAESSWFNTAQSMLNVLKKL